MKRKNSTKLQNYKNKVRFSNLEKIITMIPNSNPRDSSEGFTKLSKKYIT